MISNLINSQYLATVSLQHQKTYAQFFTHPKITEFMVKWLMEIKPNAIHDPAFGMGAFYSALQRLNFIGIVDGSEIDEKAFNFYKKHGENKNLVLKNEDYFLNWQNKWDAIICNPPYLKFQQIENRAYIFNELGRIYNTKISGHTNMSSAFLFGVFSRDKYKVIRNTSNAINLTCYHGFEPNELGEQHIDSLFLFLNSKAGETALANNRRQYGNKLNKFEPSDLNNLMVPNPNELKNMQF